MKMQLNISHFTLHNSPFSFDVTYKTHIFNVSYVVESALQNPHLKGEFCKPHQRKSVSYVSQKCEIFSSIFISHFLNNIVGFNQVHHS